MTCGVGTIWKKVSHDIISSPCTGSCRFIKMACIMWLTKYQAMVESAVFGAEFVGMKQGMEAV